MSKSKDVVVYSETMRNTVGDWFPDEQRAALRHISALTAENERLRNDPMSRRAYAAEASLATAVGLALSAQSAAPECRCYLGAVNCELHRLGAQPAAPAEATHERRLLDYVRDMASEHFRGNSTRHMLQRLFDLSADVRCAAEGKPVRYPLAAQPAAPVRQEQPDEGPDHGEADPDYPPHREHFQSARSLNTRCSAPLRQGLHQIVTKDGHKSCSLCGAL